MYQNKSTAHVPFLEFNLLPDFQILNEYLLTNSKSKHFKVRRTNSSNCIYNCSCFDRGDKLAGLNTKVIKYKMGSHHSKAVKTIVVIGKRIKMLKLRYFEIKYLRDCFKKYYFE